MFEVLYECLVLASIIGSVGMLFSMGDKFHEFGVKLGKFVKGISST